MANSNSHFRNLGIWSQTNPRFAVPFYCERVKIPIKGQVIVSTHCLGCGINLSGVGRGVSTVIFRGLEGGGGINRRQSARAVKELELQSGGFKPCRNRSSGSSGRKRERARARETRILPSRVSFSRARFFLVPTTSKRLLRRLNRGWISSSASS